MKKIEIGDKVMIQHVSFTGTVVNIIGESYEVKIGRAFFMFAARNLEVIKK